MKRILLYIGLLFCSLLAKSQDSYQITEHESIHKLEADIEIIEDELDTSQLNQIRHQTGWKKVADFKKDKSIDSKKTYWARLKVVNHLDHDTRLRVVWFTPSSMRLSYLESYILDESGNIFHYVFGYEHKKSELEGTDRRGSFPYVFKTGETTELYFKVRNIYGFRPSFDIQLHQPEAFVQNNANKLIFHWVYEGMLWIMVLYNLLLFFFVRDKTHLYYSLYIALSATYTLFFYQIFLNTVIAEIPGLNAVIWLLTLGPAMVFYFLFIKTFLQTEEILPKIWNRAIDLVIGIKLVIIAFNLVYYFLTRDMILLNIIVSGVIAAETLFSMVLIIPLMRARLTIVYYFLAASLFLWIGFFVGNYLFLLNHPYAQIIGELGVAGQILVFSLGLGYKMRKTEIEKNEAQAALIEQLQKNDEMQAKANEVLETKVRERTAEIMAQQEEIRAQNDEIMRANSELETAYRHITDSITYAKRIQTAVLPGEDDLAAFFQSYFVLYRPRDIVSGDFYWLYHIGDKILFAAVDCTGHGVPGAFLSLLGISYLNEIATNLAVSQALHANLVLEELRVQIKEALRQNFENKNNRDGMDIALCIVDKKNMRLEYAGAHNPLYIIRDENLIEYKADRMPISLHLKERPFSKHDIAIRKNDQIYLFSDGFIDQFGGHEGRKFKSKPFKELLTKNAQKPMKEQKAALETAFDEWRVDVPQLDDVLVIGLKI